MEKKNIVVLFGGCSSEYSISLESASSVINNIDRSKYTVIPVGISSAGDWYRFTGTSRQIAEDTWFSEDVCAPAVISQNRSRHELLIIHENHLERISIDAVFPVLHGRNGEDGTVQGLCELAGIPLVGCNTLASALCMDKDRAHKLAATAGVRVPEAFVIEKDYDLESTLERAEQIAYPLFIKPVKAGSSYGISKIADSGSLAEAVNKAFEYDDVVIIEEFIPGFEVGCAVMGNHELITGEIDEIHLSGGFFDFTEKYNLISSQIHVPARISKEKSDELKQTAKTIYRALGCRGFARVDMFLMPSGEIVFNEVNTIPGFTPHSRFPGMMKAVGISFGEVITQAIELAVEA